MEVGLGPGVIVSDGDPAHPHGKGHSCPPLFGPCLLWTNGRPSQLLLTLVRLGPKVIDRPLQASRLRALLFRHLEL